MKLCAWYLTWLVLYEEYTTGLIWLVVYEEIIKTNEKKFIISFFAHAQQWR